MRFGVEIGADMMDGVLGVVRGEVKVVVGGRNVKATRMAEHCIKYPGFTGGEITPSRIWKVLCIDKRD